VTDRMTVAEHIPGIVVEGDATWDVARAAWNLAADQRPAAIAFPRTPEEAIQIVSFARGAGLQIAPQATGHGAATLGPLGRAVLVKTTQLQGVQIDPDARRARVHAGVQTGQVVQAAAAHGFATLAGSAPSVGVVGYTLGGGIGWLARRYGAAATSVLAVEIITADGTLLRADPEHHADLFWAVCGGGGSFGLVTAVEIALYPVQTVYAGALFWPLERAADILMAWSEWTATIPDEMTSLGRILNLPPIPQIPEPLRGRSFVVVEAAYLGDEPSGIELLRPLRVLGPAMDTFAQSPVTALSELHMDPHEPVPAAADGALLSALPGEAVDALVAAVGRPSPLLSLEIRHLGGALAKPSHQRAFTLADAQFAVFAVGMAMNSEMAAGVGHAIELGLAALAPWRAGRNYMNFAERAVATNSLFPPATFARLRRVKATYDPGDRFLSNKPIPAS
jgi:FAD/FMN-containing dehydrogenase